jgi:hypothetical protein
MLFPFTTITLRAGLIPLLLLASVPEARCCCDLSWGPVGLLSNRMDCAATPKVQPACDCCRSREFEEGSPPVDGCRDQDCRCSFTVVSPAPIAVAPGLDAAADPFLEAGIQAPAVFISSTPSATWEAGDSSDSALTPTQRCALLQNWLS